MPTNATTPGVAAQTSQAGSVSEAHGGQEALRTSPDPADFQALGIHLADPGQQPDHLPGLGEPGAHANRASLPTAWNHEWTVDETVQMRESTERDDSASVANHASHNSSTG